MASLLAGIDVGTASSKGVITRLDGSIVGEARLDHAISIPRPGWAEQDADAVWWSDVCLIARQLAEQVQQGDHIASLAVSAIGPTLLPLDEVGRPLRPGILYGVDTRATAEIVALEGRFGRDALADFSGHGLSSQAIGPKIVWLSRHEPDVVERSRWLVTASTYITYRLTGELVIDAHTASHWNPLFDPQTLSWSAKYAGGVTPLDRLARVAWPSDMAGPLTDEAAAATDLPAGIPVAVGGVDVQSEALSVGVTDPGDLMIMYGSTAFFLLVTDAYRRADPLWMTAGPEPNRWMIAAGLATSGSALGWFRDTFAKDLLATEMGGGPNAYAALAEEAAAAGASSDSIMFLPYLSGERTPINDPQARGVLAGFGLHSTRGALYGALQQGIAHAVRSNMVAMESLGATVRRVVAVGGGTADTAMLQLVSNVCEIEQVLPEDTVGACRGDAFLAGMASGLVHRSDIDHWVRYRGSIQPDADRSARSAARHDTFLSLYDRTRSIVHDLVALENDCGAKPGF